ncbi:disulfide bond formation protein B [Pseudomonas fulva]|nr:disulfide bond formation protein B [Pseudomonas fulva]MBF8778485.1 disulfide bond formation protein B [Pseudomonas fulva]
MSLARLRSLYFPAFLAALSMLIASFYLESNTGLPCNLCHSQRVLLGGYALACLCMAIQAPGRKGAHGYAGLALLFAGSGAALAARQVWLHGAAGELGLPCEQAASAGGLSGLVQSLKALVLEGPECVSTSWSFLDLTLPEWSLLAFLLLALLPLSRLLADLSIRLGRSALE